MSKTCVLYETGMQISSTWPVRHQEALQLLVLL